MPNHVQNILTFAGSDEAVKRVLDFIKGNNPNDEGESFIDFNAIIQMPKDLDITSGGNGEIAMRYLQTKNNPLAKDKFEDVRGMVEDVWDEKTRNEALELGRKYIANERMYGAKDWYDWRRRAWGTKWNAYDVTASDDGREIWFNTAWCAPVPIVEAIAMKFPDVTIELLYADEDAGYNTGHLTFEEGECVDKYLPNGGSDEAMRIYFATHPGDEDYYVKNENGEWEWKDDED